MAESGSDGGQLLETCEVTCCLKPVDGIDLGGDRTSSRPFHEAFDLALWAGVALAIQLLCWVVLARGVFPWMTSAITANHTSAGLLLGGFSAGIGLLNAACLTY